MAKLLAAFVAIVFTLTTHGGDNKSLYEVHYDNTIIDHGNGKFGQMRVVLLVLYHELPLNKVQAMAKQQLAFSLIHYETDPDTVTTVQAFYSEGKKEVMPKEIEGTAYVYSPKADFIFTGEQYLAYRKGLFTVPIKQPSESATKGSQSVPQMTPLGASASPKP